MKHLRLIGALFALKTDLARWGKIIRERGIRTD